MIGNAVHVMRIATGEIEERTPTKIEVSAKKGGAKGGPGTEGFDTRDLKEAKALLGELPT